jgi:hypothetical protein
LVEKIAVGAPRFQRRLIEGAAIAWSKKPSDVCRSSAFASWRLFWKERVPEQARRAAGPGYTCTHPACRSELSVEPPQSTPMVAIFAFLAASTSNMQRASALVDGR